MRLVFIICLLCLSPASAPAQENQPITKRARGLTESPHVPDGLRTVRFASGLGDISTMIGDVDGSLYVSDQTRGRIFKLTDRNKDGLLDQSRIIADGFQSPSGLSVIGNYLYVADQAAIWKVPLNGGMKMAFVPLGNSQSSYGPKPLMAILPRRSDAAAALVIGLNKPDGQAELVKIDLSSRQGELLAHSAQPVLSMSRSGQSLWVGTPNAIAPVEGGAVSLSEAFAVGAPVNGLILPGQFSRSPEGFEAWSDHMFVSLGHSHRQGTMTDGSQVKTIPTQFGHTNGAAQPFVTGFTASGNRSAWGSPGAMWMNEQGLFLADSWSGIIWRISKSVTNAHKPEPEAPPEVNQDAPPLPPKATALPLVDGIEYTPASRLKAGSQIDNASRLKVGSTIVQKWEADKKAKEDAKEKSKEKVKPDD